MNTKLFAALSSITLLCSNSLFAGQCSSAPRRRKRTRPTPAHTPPTTHVATAAPAPPSSSSGRQDPPAHTPSTTHVATAAPTPPSSSSGRQDPPAHTPSTTHVATAAPTPPSSSSGRHDPPAHTPPTTHVDTAARATSDHPAYRRMSARVNDDRSTVYGNWCPTDRSTPPHTPHQSPSPALTLDPSSEASLSSFNWGSLMLPQRSGDFVK